MPGSSRTASPNTPATTSRSAWKLPESCATGSLLPVLSRVDLPHLQRMIIARKVWEFGHLKWRMITDWAKRQPVALHVADWLGRGRGKFRFFDGLHRPS